MAQIRDISKRTALYERLSKDDEQQGESNSILNQKQYLEEYAHRNGFVNIQHFTDDGYTGRNFNRPGFQEMLAEIDNGKIGTVIVKDMSRFGRNYLQVGFYTEIMFPQKQVRFIAINNSVDSDKPQDNDFTPFLNIMNEWYANQPIIINIDDVADVIDVRAEDEFARVELLVSLKQELERLSPRELMIIRTYLDYPIEDVARKLKVRPNTISKARRKIARELRKKLV